jgi:hypothetical protein
MMANVGSKSLFNRYAERSDEKQDFKKYYA